MNISIQSLSNGLNFFEFDADATNLDLDDREIGVQALRVKSKVDKGEQAIVVTSEIVAHLNLTCDNCLDQYTTVLEESYTLLYTSDTAAVQDDEMVRLLTSGTGQIDLTEGLRESVIVSLPMRFKCSDDCKGLCAKCGANLNNESCDCGAQPNDPRWDGLRGLLDKTAGAE